MKRSDLIRKEIANLMYEQTIYQAQDNESQSNIIESKITKLRSKLVLELEKENDVKIENESQDDSENLG